MFVKLTFFDLGSFSDSSLNVRFGDDNKMPGLQVGPAWRCAGGTEAFVDDRPGLQGDWRIHVPYGDGLPLGKTQWHVHSSRRPGTRDGCSKAQTLLGSRRARCLD